MIAEDQAPSTKHNEQMPIKRFEDIEAWQLARQLCRDLYPLFTVGAWARDFALRDQIDRASGSIMDPVK